LHPDFSRPVHCILGLPIDAVSEAAAVEHIRGAALQGRRCFLSTPNLNFAVASLSDPAFRDSVLHSDLNTADGMPLVWIARLLGAPIRERVAGSTVFERLRGGSPALGVYFFGGPDGVAARACERLNGEPGGLRCVGFDSPGFGSVEDMSGAERIARINSSGARVVVVSLGAKKGQAWIERNRARLDAPVISHLGAVVNFVAGTVARAPGPVQRLGLEWAWRIVEEPALWRRYFNDGATLLRLLFTRVLPCAWQLRVRAPGPAQLAAARVHIDAAGKEGVVRLAGAWTAGNLGPLRAAFADIASGEGAVHLDLSEVTHLDTAAIALICLLRGHCAGQARRGWRMSGVGAPLRRLLRHACADYLVEDLDAPSAATAGSLAC
jgi:N-acetylglucosaminyldiphosphoundecaprenol N-acetyl-beta-D-mannosaminyltransferase